MSKTIIESMEEEKEIIDQEVPLGYQRITLSTNGKLKAPKSFHVRNYKTHELIELSMTDDDQTLESVLAGLRGIVYEKDVVDTLHEKEIVELHVRLYALFYDSVLRGIDYPFDESVEEDGEGNPIEIDEELVWCKDNQPEKYEMIRDGKFPLVCEIDLTKLKIDEIDEEKKINMVIPLEDGTRVTLGLPSFADTRILKTVVEKKHKNAVKKIKDLRDKYQKDKDSLTSEEQRKVEELSKKQLVSIVESGQAMLIQKINGEEVKTFKEKMDFLQSRADLNTSVFKKYESFIQNKVPFGINPEVEVISPITGKLSTRRFSFRLLDIFQAIQLYEPDFDDVLFE